MHRSAPCPASRRGGLTLADGFAASVRRAITSLPSTWTVTESDEGEIGWYSVAPSLGELPRQGWKAHVSAAHSEAEALSKSVLPYLVSVQATFKILRDAKSIFAINSGRAGATQIGKVLTIYGAAALDLGAVAKGVLELWPSTGGPKVPSDLRVVGGSSVFLRYGTFDGSREIVDRLGRHAYAVSDPDGALVADERSTDGRQVPWAPPPPVETARCDEIAIETRFRIGDEEFIPIVLLRNSVRGGTYLGISCSDGRSAVLKTAIPGICWDMDGFDATDLLRREYDILRTLASRKVAAPRATGFAEGDPAVLVMEDVGGEPLEDQPRETLLPLLPAFARAVSDFHGRRYVHRDVKLSNAVVDGAEVRLVDFSLAAGAGTIGVVGGTQNYVPPEGAEGAASPSGDVFALGVSIAHAFLGYDPAGLPGPAGRLLGLVALAGSPRIQPLLRSALSKDPARRPTADEVAGGLEALISPQGAPQRAPDGRRRPSPKERRRERQWSFRAAFAAGLATRGFHRLHGDGQGWWRNAHLEAGFACEGINLGAAGIILGLMSIQRRFGRNDFDAEIARGCNWLTGRPPSASAVGLFSGDAGVALALGVAGSRYGRPDWSSAARLRLENAAEVHRDYDFFSGTAGILYAASILDALGGAGWSRTICARLADRLIGSVETAHGVPVWPAAEPDGRPLAGVAHGSAGGALALAVWGRRSNGIELVQGARDVFSRLFTHARLPEDGGLAHILDGNVSPAAADHTWCHGAAGYLWAMLVGLGDDPGVRDAIDWSASRFLRSPISHNAVYCHGLAGELDLCGLLGNIARFKADAEERATRVAAALRLLMQRKAGLAVWASEGPEMTTPDLWVGFLGPAVALARHGAATPGAILSPDWFAITASRS
jgi:class IV lanthipeptide synthase